MNITLTLTEATELIRTALKVPKHQELVVKIHTDDHPWAVALLKTKNEFPAYFTAEYKIPAIRKFRELGGKIKQPNGDEIPIIGLADAKWAIENMDAALDNLNKYGKLRL